MLRPQVQAQSTHAHAHALLSRLPSYSRPITPHTQDEEMHKCLKELFDAILQFARSQDVLYVIMSEGGRTAARGDGRLSAKSGGWGAVGEVSAQLGGVTIEQHLTDQMVSSAAEYKSR